MVNEKKKKKSPRPKQMEQEVKVGRHRYAAYFHPLLLQSSFHRHVETLKREGSWVIILRFANQCQNCRLRTWRDSCLD